MVSASSPRQPASVRAAPSAFAFFFSCYGAPRDLHSFPTRRSSDLIEDRAVIITLRRKSPAEQAAKYRLRKDKPKRSEEHTSELQSRRELVCRLLLEKKNKMFATSSPTDPSSVRAGA